MNQESYDRPTDYYDHQLFTIDEQICTLINQRNHLSNNNPGFPPDEALARWAKKYGFYEAFLASLFGVMRTEEYYKPRVEPTDFRKHIPVLKSIEVDERFYTVTYIRQYQNASVVQLLTDWDPRQESNVHVRHNYTHNSFELFVGEEYDCWIDSGGGTNGHDSCTFIVSPPLPDNIKGLDFVFKEYSDAFGEKSTGLMITIQAE
ncbi:hypothetical protein ACQKNC_07440 [Lysinibacillus sp. NPDC094177]|uniref:hypothetical protein n=1 Tax=Lysinibacillus sp. NPDC094177 TaxID=3390580 RepID=UPI003CFEF32E